MTVVGAPSSSADQGVDLVSAWQFMWVHRKIIAATAFLAAAAAVVLALISTPIFRAEVVLTEVNSNPMGNMSGLASQLGGLASLAGVNLPFDAGAGEEAKAILKSRRLADEFVSRQQLVPILLKSAEGEEQATPEPWFAVKRFRENVLEVKEDKRTGTIMVAMEWPDATVAAQWANAYVAMANEIIRQRALDESKRNITYLQGQTTQTNVVELQRVLYKLIEAETQKLMLANGRVEYAFSVVDPAVPPKQRIRPRRTIMVLLGTMLGVLLGVLVAFIYDRVRSSRQAVAIRPQ